MLAEITELGIVSEFAFAFLRSHCHFRIFNSNT